MRKCIFCCIFNNENYVKMFYLLLESIYIYGNLDKYTDILIYTSTPFMNIIKQSHLYTDQIKFEINDNYTTVDSACKARLDLFNLKSTSNYNKILYLDTDILIKDDINKVFDVCKDDILYVLEEGRIDSPREFYGRILFGDEINNYDNKTAFTSGILLFNNCTKTKNLFEKINQDIITRSDKNYYHDQPYIVYNAFKYNMFDNRILNKYVVNNDKDINSNKVIHHFPGGPGVYEHKIETMTTFLNTIKDTTINNNIIKTINYINEHLIPIISRSGELLEGNIFMLHHTFEYTNTFILKVKNISNMVLNKNISKVMEIGFNAGFSTLLMLMSNPNIKVTCFDLGEHSYTKPCYDKIKETFGDRINLIIGDSVKVLPFIHDTFDLIHIDGGHSIDVAESDIQNSFRLAKQRTVLIMNDYDFPELKRLWDIYVNIYDLKQLNICIYSSQHHDIKYVKTKVSDSIVNKTYLLEIFNITFLENYKIKLFSTQHKISYDGTYSHIDKLNIVANFDNTKHYIKFNSNYTELQSVRFDNLATITGKLQI